MENKIYALNIGVSTVDEKHYGQSLVKLPCCANDAKILNNLGRFCGYEKNKILLDEEATVSNVTETLSSYSKTLEKGDMLVITYSGHGSTLIDFNKDEKQGVDQTWCLYDRQLIDDELPHFWKKFKEGVFIFLILDACHSGSAMKSLNRGVRNWRDDNLLGSAAKTKMMGLTKSLEIYKNDPVVYDLILKQKNVEEKEIQCSLLSISACQDTEVALGGDYLSYFTSFIVHVLTTQKDTIRNYEDFYHLIKENSIAEIGVTPNLITYGKATNFFKEQKPFIHTKKYPDSLGELYMSLILDKLPHKEEGYHKNGLLIDLETKDKEKLYKTTKYFHKGIANRGIEKIIDTTESSSIYHLETPFSKGGFPKSPWDEAHLYQGKLAAQGVNAYVEPLFSYVSSEVEKGIGKTTDYLQNWPSPKGTLNEFTWHLDDEFTQLAGARDLVMAENKNATIKIAHIDTGYVPTHPTLPKNLKPGKSFIKGEEGKPAIDINKIVNRSSFLEQDYHGTSTMALLAGSEVDDTLAYGTGSRKIGAIPFAEVHPFRVSEMVALIFVMKNTVPFMKAIDEAIKQKCEVITISMGGLPIRGWAKAINKAYDHGITIVAAAGNNWMDGVGKLAPKHVLYPSRFERVVTAVGACYNHEPYNFKANSYSEEYMPPVSDSSNREPMQGNFYPKSAMKTAIAAYSPNIFWCDFEDQDETKPMIRKNGAGTSCAAPQVAAAAALWIVRNRETLKEKGYSGSWKQVEAVKKALFESADKTTYSEYKKYYGNGILKAKDALENIRVPEEQTLKKAKKARVSCFAFMEFVKVFFFRNTKKYKSQENFIETDLIKAEMLSQEIMQVLETDPVLVAEFFELDLSEEEEINISKEEFANLFEKVARSSYSSSFLEKTYDQYKKQ